MHVIRHVSKNTTIFEGHGGDFIFVFVLKGSESHIGNSQSSQEDYDLSVEKASLVLIPVKDI